MSKIDLSEFKIDTYIKKDMHDSACTGCVFDGEPVGSMCLIKLKHHKIRLEDVGCVDRNGVNGPYIFVKSLKNILKKL